VDRPAGSADIFVIDADGGDADNLTNSPEASDVNPDWEP
jgi:Tol biopolymer transport system component